MWRIEEEDGSRKRFYLLLGGILTYILGILITRFNLLPTSSVVGPVIILFSVMAIIILNHKTTLVFLPETRSNTLLKDHASFGLYDWLGVSAMITSIFLLASYLFLSMIGAFSLLMVYLVIISFVVGAVLFLVSRAVKTYIGIRNNYKSPR